MEAVATSSRLGAAVENRATKVSALPWYCLAVVFGATCIPIGALWDISWHSAIGRDTFWTPAHITIHLGGLIPGFTAGWLALRATYFGTAEEKAAAVRLGPFRAPLGAWVIIWGAFAMLFSAPFDDWWHNAYGLDVEILSPPHTVLAAGMYAVAIGSMLLVLSYQNRTGEQSGGRLFIYTAGVLLAMSTIIVTEKSYPNQQRGALFYQLSCAIYPIYLVAAARASKVRWAATGAALVYMGIMLAMIWILPLFKAQPLLAPIYNPVDRMVPPSFPLLLVVPGIAIDLIMARFGRAAGFWRDWMLAAVLGVAFLATFIAVQYPFAGFLISPAADNGFFAGNRWLPYFIKPGDWRFRFWDITEGKDLLTATTISIALALAIFKSRIALAVGAWMSRVQR
jgi:hypothetical protein